MAQITGPNWAETTLADRPAPGWLNSGAANFSGAAGPSGTTPKTAAEAKADTFARAKDFVDANPNDLDPLIEAVIGEDAVKTLTANELMQIEQLIRDAVNRSSMSDYVSPDFKMVGYESDSPIDADWLPDNVPGAFVTEDARPTARGGGTVMLWNQLWKSPEDFAAVSLEEFGESLSVFLDGSDLFEDLQIEVADGDVGARISAVMRGKQIAAADWTASPSDTTEVKLDGEVGVDAFADSLMNWDETDGWGHTDDEITAGHNLALDFITDQKKAGTGTGGWERDGDFDRPSTINGREWDKMWDLYGQPTPTSKWADTDDSGRYMTAMTFTRAAADGVLYKDNAGQYQVNIQEVSPSAIRDSMFQWVNNKYYGGAEDRTSMTMSYLNKATDEVLGDVEGVTSNDFDYLIKNFSDWTSSTDPNDRRFTRDAVESMFTVGGISIMKQGGDEKGHVSIDVLGNPVPEHHHKSWWDTAMSWIGHEVGVIVSDVAQLVGAEARTLADWFNGKLTAEEAFSQGVHEAWADIKQLVKDGDDVAINLIEKIGEGVERAASELLDEADHAMFLIGHFVDQAVNYGEEVAMDILSDLGKLAEDELVGLLDRQTEVDAVISYFDRLTFEEAKEFIPDYDELYSNALVVKQELIDQQADGTLTFDDAVAATGQGTAGTQALLQSQGMKVDQSGTVLNSDGTQADERSFYDKYMRVDFGVDLKFEMTGASIGPVKTFDNFAASAVISLPRKDAAGNEYIQFRVREKDGVGGKFKATWITNETKLGAFGTHELNKTFYTDVVDQSAANLGLRWRSNVGIEGKNKTPIKGAANYMADLMSNAASTAAENTTYASANWTGVATALEAVADISELDLTATASHATTFNIDRWPTGTLHQGTPIIAEMLGAATGTIGGAILLAGLEGFSEGAATPFIEDYGMQIEHVMALLGVLAADKIVEDVAQDKVGQNASADFFGGAANAGFVLKKDYATESGKFTGKGYIKANISDKQAVAD